MVEDVVTTGLSSREAIEAVRECRRRGGLPRPLWSIVRAGRADLGIPFIPLIRIDVPAYEAEAGAARAGRDPGDEAGEPRRRVTGKLRLGVNIDHVATIRNARGGDHPDPVRAAIIAAEAGADGITAHLREDRRHITDDDIDRLMAEIDLPLNLEMAATEEMLAIALATSRTPPASSPSSARSGRPRAGSTPPASTITSPIMSTSSARRTSASACSSSRPKSRSPRRPARRAGRRVPHRPLRPCDGEERAAELKRIADCAALAAKNGIEPHAGHGLTFDNVVPVAAIPQLAELNIGHFLIGEAIFTGLDASVRRMRELMDEAR